MDNKSLIFLIILILCLPVNAGDKIKNISSKEIQVGDESVEDNFYDYIQKPPKKNKLERKFSLEYYPDKVNLSYEIYHSEKEKNWIKVNDVLIGSLCINRNRYDWESCMIEVNRNILRRGVNKITFFHKDWDDYVIRDVNLLLEYRYIQPKLTVDKLSKPETQVIFKPINIDVDVTNIGLKPAYNVTLFQYHSPELKLINGSRILKIERLESWGVVSNIYQVTANTAGIYQLPGGIIFYQNNSGFEFNSTISPSNVTFIQPKPSIKLIQRPNVINKSIGEDFKIYLIIHNKGPTSVTGLKTRLTLPGEYMLNRNHSTVVVPYLGPNKTKNISFTIGYNHSISVINRFKAEYNVFPFQNYTDFSNEIKINVRKETGTEKLVSNKMLYTLLQLLVLFIGLLLLVLIYLRKFR